MVLSPQEIDQIEKIQTENLEAYDLYHMGHFFLNKRTEKGLKKSVNYFEQSIKEDSNYAQAYAGLADAYAIMHWWRWLPRDEALPKAKKMALKALEIDPNLAEAHATLGSIIGMVEWQWETGEKHLQKAIELNPNYATARQYYSSYLDVTRQTEEARQQITRALELDPLSLVLHIQISAYHWRWGEYDMALKESQRILELTPNRSNEHWRRFRIYFKLGKNEEALVQLKKYYSADTSTEKYAKLAEDIFINEGIDELFLWAIGLELEFQKKSYKSIALCYAILGKNDLALELLEKTFEEHPHLLSKINNNQHYNHLRSNPRFVALLKKMNLPLH